MQIYKYSKMGLIACIAVLSASVHVHANMAEAGGMLADMYVAKAEASTAMAAASSSGGSALGAAQAKLSKINEAITEAQKAYSQMEAAGGDDAAAMQALRTQRQLALGEDATPQAGSDQPYTVPNIYSVPWETDGQRSVHDSQYQIEMDTSTFGGAGFAERDFDVTRI